MLTSSNAFGDQNRISLGGILAKQKWVQVKIGFPVARRLIKKQAPTSHENTEALSWFMFFALASELMEATEIMDAPSFERLNAELEVAVAHIGPAYMDTLSRFCKMVADETKNGVRRYRVIAATCRVMIGLPADSNLPTVLPKIDLTAKDPELDGLELNFIKNTQICRFLADQFTYKEEWLPRHALSTHWMWVKACREAGCIALEPSSRAPGASPAYANAYGDLIGYKPFERVIGVCLGEDGWLLRPGRLCGSWKIVNDPPIAHLFVFPKENSLRTAVKTAIQGASRHKRRAMMYFNALDRGNVQLVVGDDPFPDTSKSLGSEIFSHKWTRILDAIKPGDILFSRDTQHRLSTLIANLDGGSWSHCAPYIGDGLLDEVELKGQEPIPLQNYGFSNYRLALLRSMYRSGQSPARRQASKKANMELARRHEGRPYSYLGAISAGLECAIFNEPARTTPNAMIRRGDFVPVVVS
jgi:hypothetical protein